MAVYIDIVHSEILYLFFIYFFFLLPWYFASPVSRKGDEGMKHLQYPVPGTQCASPRLIHKMTPRSVWCCDFADEEADASKVVMETAWAQQRGKCLLESARI